MAGLSLTPEPGPGAGRGENPDVNPEVERLRSLGPLELTRPQEVAPPALSSREASQLVMYLQRQGEETKLRLIEFLEEVEARDKLRTDAILNMQAQIEEAVKRNTALLDKAGLSIKTIEISADSTIKRLDQTNSTVGALGQALKSYALELNGAMRSQVEESARQASGQMWASLEPRFSKAFMWLWITLALFIVSMAATLALFWPSQPESAPRQQPTTAAPQLNPKAPQH